MTGDIYQEPENYRGSLVYTQEYGYKTVTMAVSVAANEQSHVITHAHHLPVSEEAEHLSGIDLYHFIVTDGTQIQLLVETPTSNKEAYYTVCQDDIIAERSPIEITIVRSSESIPFEYAHSQEALDEALTHDTDQRPARLDETPRCTPVYDFGR